MYAVGWVKGVYVDTAFVDVIDTHMNEMTAAIELGNEDQPTRIAVTPDGGRAFVAGEVGHLWVVDTTANALFSTITVSLNNPLDGIAITPDGARVYVSCGNTNTIYVLGTNGSAIVGTIPSYYPLGLTITRAI